MSITHSIKTLGCLYLVLPLTILAQDSEDTTVDSVLEQRGEDMSRHVPKSKKALEAEAETTARAAKPLPNQALDATLAKKNEIGRQRVLEILAQRTKYNQQLLDGEVVHNSFILEKVPQAQAQLPDLEQLYKDILVEKDAQKKVELTDALLLALQPFGIILEDAEHKEADLSLTPQQVKQMESLLNEKSSVLKNMDKDPVPMRYVGRQLTYTLLDVPTPLVFIAKPNSEVFLESSTGGVFENGLSMIKLTADSKGIVSTRWMSEGDAVSETRIYAFSASTSDVGSHLMRVVDLKLRDLPTIEELKSKAQQAKQQAAHTAN